MESDFSRKSHWVHRRFFLSNIPSAPRLFAFNTSTGFVLGQIHLDNDELTCELIDEYRSEVQLDHLAWSSETVYRSSAKQIRISWISLPNNNRSERLSGISTHPEGKFQLLEKSFGSTPSSIDWNQRSDRIAISDLNGTVKFFDPIQFRTIDQSKFANDGILHRLQWNPHHSELLLLSHQHRLNIFDGVRRTINVTLTQPGHEHLADSTWKTSDILLSRHRNELLVWDRRVSREPIRSETIDKVGQVEKMKCSFISSNDLISIYDSRLSKIKIFDFRSLTMQQVEVFDPLESSLLDYHWMSDRASLIVATHQGSLHWIDVNNPSRSKK